LTVKKADKADSKKIILFSFFTLKLDKIEMISSVVFQSIHEVLVVVIHFMRQSVLFGSCHMIITEPALEIPPHQVSGLVVGSQIDLFNKFLVTGLAFIDELWDMPFDVVLLAFFIGSECVLTL